MVTGQIHNGWELVQDGESKLTFVEDIAELKLVEFLKHGEKWINDEKLIDRAKELNADLGWKDLKFLLDNPEKIPENFRIYYLLFTGMLWRDGDGKHRVAYLNWDWDDARWQVNFRDDFFRGGLYRLLRLDRRVKADVLFTLCPLRDL